MINNLIFYKLLPASDFQSPHPYVRATRGRARSALRRGRRPENYTRTYECCYVATVPNGDIWV